MKTRNQVINTRSNGLRYFDRAVEKVGRTAILERAIAIAKQFPKSWREHNADWALGNAVIELLDPPGDIQQSYNVDEALTPEEIKQFTLQTGQKVTPCRERKPECQPPISVLVTAVSSVTPILSDSTEACKQLLEQEYKNSPSGNAKLWKRTRKYRTNDLIVREFNCPTTGEFAAITYHETKGLQLVKSEDISKVPALLIQAAQGIPHSGDYGELFWNPATRTVWWVMSDSDGDGDEIETTLTVPGVLQVITADEREPEEPGYIKLEY